jgi:hypothetical protein
MAQYARAMRAVGPAHCILSSDLGGVRPPPAQRRPLEPDGMLAFMQALRAQGLPVADINQMAKTNPAHVLGLDG